MTLALILTAHDPITGQEISAYPIRPVPVEPGTKLLFIPETDNRVRIQAEFVNFDPEADVTRDESRTENADVLPPRFT